MMPEGCTVLEVPEKYGLEYYLGSWLVELEEVHESQERELGDGE
jgi:hypothetical protein